MIDRLGAEYVAHYDDGHDCAADDPAPHGVADHPTAALRRLIAAASAPTV